MTPVKKPDRLSYEAAVAGIGDCLKAYTALYYQAHVCGGDTVLIIDGASSFGNVAIQLASQWGAKVYTETSDKPVLYWTVFISLIWWLNKQPHSGNVYLIFRFMQVISTASSNEERGILENLDASIGILV